jgi:hypothetical protein
MTNILIKIVLGLAISIAAVDVLAAEDVSATRGSSDDKYFSYGYRVGDRVNDITFKDIDGISSALSKPSTSQATIVVVRDSECPVSQRYSPRLAELEQAYGPKGFGFIYIDVTPHGAAEARQDASSYQLKGRIVLDPQKKLIRALRATTSTEVFVIDSHGTLRYRGAIDDQYGIGYSKDAPDHAWLRSALDQINDGKTIATESTPAPGCMLDTDMDVAGKARPVTYHNRISRIIQRKCEQCHHEGGIAPMPLQNYAQVFQRRMMIDYMTSNYFMPPWSANRHVGVWENDPSLTDRDLKDLHGWIKAGAPEGKASDAPIARQYTPGWTMEKPDAILQIPEKYVVPKEGVVVYKYFYLKTNFDTDKWISEIEIHPTAPRVVHHVLVYLEKPGHIDNGDPSRKPGDPLPAVGVDDVFATTAPGLSVLKFPEGTAKKLPKGAWLKFQVHFQPNGTEQIEQTQIALKFADDANNTEGKLKAVRTDYAYNDRFEIPPEAANHEISAKYEFRSPGTLLMLFPHMHLRGKAWQVKLVTKEGAETLLLDVPKYNFAWQHFYRLKEPIHVEPGMKLLATGWYDNSADNPANPDHTATVHWGDQTFEEMMIGFFDWIPDK